MKTTLQILEDALVLVTDGWGQHHWACNRDGCFMNIDDPKASCFCAEGALIRASGGNGVDMIVTDALVRLKEAISTTDCIPTWNDHHERTQDEVVAAFKTAIALEKRWLAGV